jgi:tRNA/tmRNA/rRNA uracil-C5-methylase (TrmA/RlmC/RlmD family)
MAEEIEEKQGFFGQLKTQIIGGAGILLTGIGTMFIDEVKSFVGIESSEDSATHAPVQQQNVNVTGPEITINMPEQRSSTTTREIIREVPAQQAKPDTVVVAPPSARDRLLNRRN